MPEVSCCPTRVRTWTLLIQSQSCCQLHHWALIASAKIHIFYFTQEKNEIFCQKGYFLKKINKKLKN